MGFWEKRVISRVTIEKNEVSPVPYPNTGEYIYRAGVFPDGRVIAVGESGLVLIYHPKTNTWDKKKLPGYEKRCIYSLVVINDSVAFATGGHNRIAHSEGVIPRGFIIGTTDGGLSWKRIHSFPTSMVWSIAMSQNNPDQLYFSVYCPPFTSLFSFTISTKEFSFSTFHTGLFHDLILDKENRPIFCGSAGINYKKNGRVLVAGNKRFKAGKDAGAFWNIKLLDNYYVVTGSKGRIIISKDLDNWMEINLPMRNNLYASISTGKNKFLVAGQNQTLLEISFCEEGSEINR
jgi:hypothetical protein